MSNDPQDVKLVLEEATENANRLRSKTPLIKYATRPPWTKCCSWAVDPEVYDKGDTPLHVAPENEEEGGHWATFAALSLCAGNEPSIRRLKGIA
ncbi:hypothetical protein J3F83DRAFT_719213 [Trichoderma novae-zelandiae]